ncbi:hypothetical protein STEG23_009044 [Scotinomys teguina]
MELAAAAPAQRLANPAGEDRAPAAAAEGGPSPDPALSVAAASGGNGGAARAGPCEAPPGPMPGRAGGTGRRRRRGAPQPAAGGAVSGLAAGGGANSLLLRRGRLKRNLSAAAAASSSSSPSSAAAGLPASCSASASLCTRSLDRKTLLLKHRQLLQLQPSDRDWVRHQLQRGCVHVFDRHMASSYQRPVLCTLDTTAAEVAARLLQLGHKGGGVVKVLGQGLPPSAAPAGSEQTPDAELGTDVEPPPSSSTPAAVGGPSRAPPADLPLPEGAWTSCAPRASPAPSDSSPGELFADGPGSPPRAPHPASDTESFSLSPSAESVSDRLDPYSSGGGSSSSEELEADPALGLTGAPGPPSLRPGRPAQPRPPSPKTSPPLQPKAPGDVDGTGGMAGQGPREGKVAAAAPGGLPSTPGKIRETAQKTSSPPSLYVQFHGETTRRLEADEKPLQIQNDYLFQLGFGELWRVQEEGMDSEIGCLIRFYAGHCDTGTSVFLESAVHKLPEEMKWVLVGMAEGWSNDVKCRKFKLEHLSSLIMSETGRGWGQDLTPKDNIPSDLLPSVVEQEGALDIVITKEVDRTNTTWNIARCQRGEALESFSCHTEQSPGSQ